eukprot:scaffold12749_cov44-Phaeocystis_antarctica.AAC.1
MTAESMCTSSRLSARCLPLANYRPKFCCVSARSRWIELYHPLSSKNRARSCLSRLACGGRAAAHDTRETRSSACIHSGIRAAQQRPFIPRRPVNAETQNKRKTLLLYILCRAVWTVVYLYGAEDTGLV